MKAPLQHYHARMQRVLEHIDRHLEGNLSLDVLSGVAAFSKHHFHRQFTVTFGLSVHRYVQLSRMKRASYLLAYRATESVTNIAMDAGYEAPDAFARAFRQRLGQSPSALRKSPDWEPWLAAFGPLDNARSKLVQKTFTDDDVTIRDVAPTPVAIMKHRGDPAAIGTTIRRFIAWRKATGLTPRVTPTFNVFHSDPRTTPPDEYRLDLCVGTDGPIEVTGEHLEQGMIPGGRCAVLRVVGNTDNLEPAADYLYRDWLPVTRLAFMPRWPIPKRPGPASFIAGVNARWKCIQAAGTSAAISDAVCMLTILGAVSVMSSSRIRAACRVITLTLPDRRQKITKSPSQ